MIVIDEGNRLLACYGELWYNFTCSGLNWSKRINTPLLNSASAKSNPLLLGLSMTKGYPALEKFDWARLVNGGPTGMQARWLVVVIPPHPRESERRFSSVQPIAPSPLVVPTRRGRAVCRLGRNDRVSGETIYGH